jgi:hypothetical protein
MRSAFYPWMQGNLGTLSNFTDATSERLTLIAFYAASAFSTKTTKHDRVLSTIETRWHNTGQIICNDFLLAYAYSAGHI